MEEFSVRLPVQHGILYGGRRQPHCGEARREQFPNHSILLGRRKTFLSNGSLHFE